MTLGLVSVGLYRLAAEDSDDSLLASVSVAASLPILLPYLSSASVSARVKLLNVKMLTFGRPCSRSAY